MGRTRTGSGTNAARVALFVGVAACLAVLSPCPVDYARFFDPDDATQGIFVNDLTFRGDYDQSFAGSNEYQDLYRADWAAQRLPYSLVVSGVQRVLGVAPYDVEGLLTVFAVVFAALGTWFAALCLTRGEEGLSVTRLAIFGIALVHPSLVLFSRSAASFYLLAYMLFWACLYTALRYAESGRKVYLGLAAVSVAVFAINPYPPVLVLPIALFAAFGLRGELPHILRDRRVWAAVAVSALLAVATTAALGILFEGSALGFAERILRFQGERAARVGWAQLVDVSLLDKLHKWVDQHFLFLVDSLGDPTRTDAVWTLGVYHSGFLGLLPLSIYGAVTGWRAGDAGARFAAAILAAFAGVFFSVSFPEGRYILALVPCYAGFAVRGLKSLFDGAGPQTWQLVLTLLLLLLSLETHIHLARVYEPRSERIWADFDGMRELAPLLAPFAGDPTWIQLPAQPDYGAGLYFRMVMDPAWRWVGEEPFERAIARGRGPRLVVADAVEAGSTPTQHGRPGFEELERFETGRNPRSWIIWTRPPREIGRLSDRH